MPRASHLLPITHPESVAVLLRDFADEAGARARRPGRIGRPETMGGAMMATPTSAAAPETSQMSAPVPAPVLPPLQIGRHTISPRVVLAPMAGITNRAFRRLCREYGREGLEQGGASGATSLYVSEMITSRALVEAHAESMRLIGHDPDENPDRSSSTASTPPPWQQPCGCWSPRTARTTST